MFITKNNNLSRATTRSSLRFRLRLLRYGFVQSRTLNDFPYKLDEVSVEPLNTLGLRLIHRLSVLLRAPITPQRKAMNLIFINSQLVRNACLLSHNILNFAHLIVVQETVLIANSQAERLGHWVEVSGDGNKSWMASIGSIDLSMCSKDCIPSSPTEANSTDLPCAWERTHC